MRLIDTNLLIYAVNEDAPEHGVARDWLDDALSGVDTVAFAWLALIGFVRISSHPRLSRNPLPADEAMERVESWLAQPNARILDPLRRHATIMRELLSATDVAGNLTNDVHLAALAIEHGAVMCSADNDFGRFAGLRWTNPLD
ncbi:MAG: type II toxin-antitoxin system VapC family toxin [Mycobacteriaceae bacterium]